MEEEGCTFIPTIHALGGHPAAGPPKVPHPDAQAQDAPNVAPQPAAEVGDGHDRPHGFGRPLHRHQARAGPRFAGGDQHREDPAELARQFCAKHTLDAGVEAVVQRAIEEKMRSYGL